MSYRAMGLALLSGLVFAGCTAPNPRSCADGLCTDQRYPYCDGDGTFEGAPDTCIAVDCEPSSFVRCLADQSVKCNAGGNDYTIVMCEQGCNDTTGCKQCSSNDQCTADAPICNVASGSCRTCALDDECSSRVCEVGACIAESGILYASTGGADNSPCSKAVPCSVSQAFTLARTAAFTPVIRFLPGTYVNGLSFQQATSLPVKIVATGAMLAAPVGLSVTNGASVVVRGLSISSSETAIVCGASGQPEARLTFRDGRLVVASNLAYLVRAEECTIEMTASELQLNASTGGGVFVSTNGRFSGDRLRITGTADGVIGVGGIGSRMSVRLSNSLVEGVGLLMQATDSTDPGSYAYFGYNTIVLQSSNSIGCSGGFGSAHRTMTLDNNIVSGANVVDVVEGTLCTVRSNVLFPSVGRPDNVAALPLFRDAANHDFHLMLGSPAIDVATVTSAFPAATADLEGVTRPQGAKPDVGAFEFVP